MKRLITMAIITTLLLTTINSYALSKNVESPKWLQNLVVAQDKNVTQIFVVACDGKDLTTATASLHNKDEKGNWKEILNTKAYIGKNGTCYDEEHYEGCGQTPIGTYHFNKAFGIADDPGSILPYTKVDENIYWSGDQRKGMHYNEMVNIKEYPNLDKNASEHIIEYNTAYKYCLNISFNDNAELEKGSAIFLHCYNGNRKNTGGCIAIPEEAVKFVLKNANKNTIVLIDTKDNLENTANSNKNAINFSDDSSDFVNLSEVVPDAILEMRYYSTYNFVGKRINGYEEPLAFLTKEAAKALKHVSDDLIKKGYRLKIYDAYRPQRAVNHFVKWSKDLDDIAMKQYFYPTLSKNILFPKGYIAIRSGHSRGSTVDLTLFDMKSEKEVDMGGTFDYFGELSHPDYKKISDEQYANRMILRDAMIKYSFEPLSVEWWHFTLKDEPYPNTYFTFPINSSSLTSK